jgi:tRNA-splicing ligase RtcB
MNVIKEENAVPVFSWCDGIEKSALDQMITIAKLPFVKHCALMPDAHMGMKDGAPIGSVIATEDVVIPNAVGVDVSCGVSIFKTNLNINDFTNEKKQIVHHAVERTIPTGFSHNSDKRRDEIEGLYGQEIDRLLDFESDVKIADRKETASQLGTLGGG